MCRSPDEPQQEGSSFSCKTRHIIWAFSPWLWMRAMIVCDTAKLLVFVCGITENFKITEELAAMQSMKGTTTGSDLFTEVYACFEKLGLKWDKLVCITSDGCPNRPWKNVEQENALIHPMVLGKSVLKCSIQLLNPGAPVLRSNRYASQAFISKYTFIRATNVQNT